MVLTDRLAPPFQGDTMALDHVHPTVAIRAARGSDGIALARLAELDSRRPLTGDVLVAEADGAVIAALSIDENRAVADIFKPTAEIVSLLRSRRQAIVARP
jgi:hypothetical protein